MLQKGIDAIDFKQGKAENSAWSGILGRKACTMTTGVPVMFPLEEMLLNRCAERPEGERRGLLHQLRRRVLYRAQADASGLIVCRYDAEFKEEVKTLPEALQACWVRWTRGVDGPTLPLIQADRSPGVTFVLIGPETDLVETLLPEPAEAEPAAAAPLATSPRSMASPFSGFLPPEISPPTSPGG